MKKIINSKKILQKSILIPNQSNNAKLTVTVQEACQRASQAFVDNYLAYAEAILEATIKAVPAFAPPYAQLARILMRAGKKSTSRDVINKAITIDPNNYKLLYDAAILFSIFYENERSFELIQKASQLAPDSPIILNQYGLALLKRDEKDKASQVLKKAISADPLMGESYYNLATCDIDAISEDMLQFIMDTAKKTTTSAQNKIMFLYAAAKKLQKLGKLDEEFSALDEANKMMRQQATWTWQQELEKWYEFKQKFDSAFVKKIRLTQNSEIKPILIATLPRSGSTLVEQIFAAHSTVCAAGESNLFHGPLIETAHAIWNNRRYWQYINEDNSETYLNAVVQRVKEVMTEQKLDKSIVTDKSLKNTYIVGLVLCAFPEARIIHCVRNPLDNALSCFQTYLVNGHEYANDLADTIRVGQIYDQAMTYWKSIFPESILTVNYEELVENQEEMTRKMLAFCGLEWEDSCLNFHENKLVVHTASLTQVRQPMNKRGLARWEKYAAHMAPAIEALKQPLGD